MGGKESHPATKTEIAPVESEQIPILHGEAKLLQETPENITLLSSSMPSSEYRVNWNLLYDSTRHGKSFNRFCYHITGKGSTLVIIRDTDGNVFGGFADESWKDKYPKFYGSVKNFLFSLKPERRIYRPTGYNQNYQYINFGTETLYNGVGQGGQTEFFGWCINDDFEKGHSKGIPSTTYGNHPFNPKENYLVDRVEVWQVKESTDLRDEIIEKKKNKTKSVLDDDDNADKVITGMMGHDFSHYDINEEKQDEGKGHVLVVQNIKLKD